MPTALITGASAGIGEEFAYALARDRFELVLTARREDRLRQVAERATAQGASAVHVIAADLARRETPAAIFDQVERENLRVDYLVNNAGFGTRGRFSDQPLDRELEEIDLNVTALVALTRKFLPPMIARHHGTIINVASTAGFQPLPFMATYAATKAFVVSFSQAIAAEAAGTGVRILALCPGPTRSEFHAVAGIEDARTPEFMFMDVKTVVAQGLAAARRGKWLHINGALNFVLAESIRIAPRTLATRIAARLYRPAQS
ncbi:MAG: SDR family oxidoreductase [Candidatus Binataceae bacterium]|nr:SDR family oxidoreductase [Candidatus Binataceae bacterium]